MKPAKPIARVSSKIKRGTEFTYQGKSVFVELEQQFGNVLVCDSEERGLSDNYFTVKKSELNPIGNKPINKTTYQTKEIKKVSTRQQKLNAAYKILRDQFMKSHKACEANLQGCKKKATECHHVRGRGQYYLDDTTYLALCSPCHKWVNEHNEAASEMGFCKSRLEKIKKS